VIRHGQGRHPAFLGFGDQPIQLACAVEEGVLGMDVEMDEISVLHGQP
jgi:hypothetical protein